MIGKYFIQLSNSRGFIVPKTLVDLAGFEPATSSLQMRRSAN